MILEQEKIFKKVIKELCKELEVDEIEYDTIIDLESEPDETFRDTTNSLFGFTNTEIKRFYSPKVKWRIGKKRFRAKVPVRLKTERFKTLLKTGNVTDYDWSEMKIEMIKLIMASKRKLSDEK